MDDNLESAFRQPPPRLRRKLFKNQKALNALRRAGDRGCTTVQLARAAYGKESPGNVAMMIQGLRRKGHKILTTRNEGYADARFVLEPTQDEQKNPEKAEQSR